MSRSNGYQNGISLSSMPGSAMSSSTRLATPQGGSHRPVSPGSASALSRADKFDDEKRRITESCFSKQDQSGQLTESYITHIRIVEDAQYPTAPPPPTSPSENKKPRVIIIAVRSTGRVRMHKARENANGTFSIGKTWNMEELSAIETYANSSIAPQEEREAQQRAWAGSLGFTVTITKPYYWQAGSSKEKDFFIASAVKIFRKYTKGQLPELRGFDDAEKASLLGLPAGQAAPLMDNMEPPAPPQPPFARREQSQEGSRYRSSPGPPPGSTPGSRNPSESPARYNYPQQQTGGPRQFMSNDQLRGQSRDAGRPEQRPGTSPAPDYRNSPVTPGQRSGTQTPQMPAFRTDSPGTPGREYPAAPPPFAPQSPARQRTTERSYSNSSSGAQAPPNRWASDRNDQPPPLPPIETTSSRNVGQSEPKTATTLSSPGFDLGDAAAIGAITSFWAPDNSNNSQPSLISESASPPTPERSKRRPAPIEPRTSDSMADLRPPPLSQARRLRQDSGSRAMQEEPDRSVRKSDDTPEVRPLQILNKSETPLSTPSVSSLVTAQESPKPTREDVSSHAKSDSQATEEDSEQFRPGLGPMFKKRVVADRLKKAATTASAFKPRPGGAAEKILKAKAEREAGAPDGITGVVPRPVARAATNESSTQQPLETEPLITEESSLVESPAAEFQSPPTPVQEQPNIDSPFAMDSTQGVELVDEVSHLEPPSQTSKTVEPDAEDDAEQIEERQVRKPQVKIKRRGAQQEKYLMALGIDRSLLEGRGLEFENMLSDFGWSNQILQTKHLAALEADIRREQGRVEAGSWLSHTDAAREERVAHVESLLDKAIAECDELEGLLTLYNVELSSLNDDISFIEAQSQGLQVQSANQKLLQTELQGLVETMSLDRHHLEPIRYGDLSSAASLEEVEQSLVRLYQALLTMDPSIRATATGRPGSRNGISEIETATMAALREKKIVYERESSEFCQRLIQFLDSRLNVLMNGVKSQVLRIPASGGLPKLHSDAFTEVRNGLWMYSPVILFTKEINATAWQGLLRTYQTRAKLLYLDSFKQNLANWKRASKDSTGDDLDLLFTTQEKEDPSSGGLTSTARKMTVKRSQTLARTLRGAGGGDKHGKAEPRTPGALMRSAAFAGAMDEMAPLMSREQNFIIDLFHATSLETVEFTDIVQATPPGRRHGTNLLDRKPTEPDREIARLVMLAMAEIFGFFTDELSSLLDWSVMDDPLQGVGVLTNLSRHTFYLQDTSQEFLLQVFETLSARLQTRFAKFVEEQIRAIEDTKVKIKKRKGVIAFMKVFPNFSAGVENIFASVAGNDYDGPSECVMEVRRLIDNAYERINRAMFDSLKVIAKESPVAGVQAPQQSRPGDDSEDKEMLNYHILLIENMNHYVEEVDEGGRDGVLADWKNRALLERAEALEAYVARVLRRPLGKLLDFLEAAESILATSPGNSTAVSSRPSYSRKAMRTVLAQYDSKEVRRGIDTLRRRIEKHFGDADEETISRSLVNLVCSECERSYERVLERTEKLVQEVYPPTEGEKTVEIDFTKADIQADFRR